MNAATLFSAILETALNAWLAQDAQSIERLAGLSGATVEIHLRDLGLSLYFFSDGQRVQVQSLYEGQPDARIVGTLAGLAASLRGDAERRLFDGALAIEGDTDLAHRFQRLLADVEFDWEEQLSRLTGDVVAHQAGNLLRSVGRFLRHGNETLRQDLGEYLQEEARIAPTRIEIEHFLSQVDRLRSDAERLAARIARLQREGAAPS
jgi:ubiquinone biosynthesis protein UbiJ